MHRLQKLLLDMIKTGEITGSYSLRKIAELIGAKGMPQVAKYHLQQLEKQGFIQVNLEENILKLVKKGFNVATKSPLYTLPVYGSANCGPATIFAEQNIEGYLKVSSGLLPRSKKGLFVLKASGVSMNRAQIEGKTIEDGDFVLVDSNYKNFKTGDVVVAAIDDMATIKRYRYDKVHERIMLEADSNQKYLPIILHEEDNFLLNGKVIDIIKG